MAVVAYELLYRASPTSRSAQIGDPGSATLEVITGAALEIGLDRLAGGLPVHINFPQELLANCPSCRCRPSASSSRCWRTCAPLLRSSQGIRALRARGHRIALDDYSPQGSDPRLLEVADIVKLEITHPPADEFARHGARSARRGLGAHRGERRRAGRISSAASRWDSRGFQGNFLQQPETFSARRVPVSRLGRAAARGGAAERGLLAR